MKLAVLASLWVPFAQTALPDHNLLTVWGPLGVICAWLMWRDERRDKIIRESADKNVVAMERVAHKLNGLSRALIFNAATHAPNGIKELAEKELAEMDRKMQDFRAPQSPNE